MFLINSENTLVPGGIKATSVVYEKDIVAVIDEEGYVLVANYCSFNKTLGLFINTRIRGTQICSHDYNVYIIDEDNYLWSLTEYSSPQFKKLEWLNGYVKMDIQISSISVSHRGIHRMFIDLENNLWVFGDNYYGQCGIDYCVEIKFYVKTIHKAKSVSCGGYHSAFIDLDDYLWVTGNNCSGQLGIGTNCNVGVFTKTEIKAQSVSCGNFHTGIIDFNNHLWMTGCSGYGQLGLDVHENINTFKNTELVVNTVKCFNNCTMIINDDGTTYVTGSNYKGRLISNYDNDTIQEFTQIPDFIHKMSTNRFKKTKSARN